MNGRIVKLEDNEKREKLIREIDKYNLNLSFYNGYGIYPEIKSKCCSDDCCSD